MNFIVKPIFTYRKRIEPGVHNSVLNRFHKSYTNSQPVRHLYFV